MPEPRAPRPPRAPLPLPGRAELGALASDLLTWYGTNARRLPWRASRDPYAIWVSETMLQQTQVATVVGYFQRWMQRFPTVSSLAQADEAAVLHAWQGLGYYSRARRLAQAARQITETHQGQLPRTVGELRALPGVGRYTAGAIASIAYQEPAPLVDGNVTRVLTRLFGLRGDPTKAPLLATLWHLAERLLEGQPPGELNQALMELGAVVCTPRAPKCETCPVRSQCTARARGMVERLPELPARKALVSETHVAALVRRGADVLLVRGMAGFNRWQGLWQFPHSRLDDAHAPETLTVQKTLAVTGVRAEAPHLFARIRHTITHHRITLDCYQLQGHGTARPLQCEAAQWTPISGLLDVALPTPHGRIARQLMRGSARPTTRAPSARNRL